MSSSLSRVVTLSLFLPLLGLASCGLIKKGGADASADADTTADTPTPSSTASTDTDTPKPAYTGRIVPRDAGVKKDGGTVSGLLGALDASAPSIPTLPSATAGGGAPVAPPGSVEVAPTGGTCPADFSLGRDQRCHKNCASGPAVCKLARCSSNCGTSGPVCVTPLSACAGH